MDTDAVRLDTLVTRTDRAPGSLPDVAPALHQTATFRATDDATFLKMSTTPRHDAYYTRDGNPTISDVEALIAALEGAETCLLTASGMGAMSTAVLGLVRQGDHVVAQRSHYMGTTQLLGEVLIVEVHVLIQAQLYHPCPNLLGHSMHRRAPAVAVHHALCPQLAYLRPHPPPAVESPPRG